MKIVVCYKCVVSDDSISVAADRSLDLSHAQWEVGQFDLRAVQAAMDLIAECGGSVSALTAAGEIVSNSKMKKAILSRGPEAQFGVQDSRLTDADETAVAEVLAAAIKKIGDADLILFGEGSGDMYSQQMGNLVGGFLGWNTLNAVCSIAKTDDALRVKRISGNVEETLEVQLPAVISVTGDINTPKIPTMKDILAAGKKPSTVWSIEDLGMQITEFAATDEIKAPQSAERKRQIFEGCDEDTIKAFAACIQKAM